MARNYIDGGVKFKRHDFVTVDMISEDGTVTEDLEPRRLFPVNDEDNYISLLDADGHEQGIGARRTDRAARHTSRERGRLRRRAQRPGNAAARGPGHCHGSG